MVNNSRIELPENLLIDPVEIGIDEAGRGPVLGPMVYSACVAPVNYSFPSSVNDSKKIKRENHAMILSQLQSEGLGFVSYVATAEEISSKCFQQNESLNSFSYSIVIDIIKQIAAAGAKIKCVYIDTVGDSTKYKLLLEKEFKDLRFVVEDKSDSKYKIVGAASIHAKVTRDKELKDFVFEETDLEINGHDYGSGYPHDQKTMEWLENNFDPVFGFPSIVRFNWTPIRDIFTRKNAEVQFPEYSYPKQQKTFDSAFFSQRNLQMAKLG